MGCRKTQQKSLSADSLLENSYSDSAASCLAKISGRALKRYSLQKFTQRSGNPKKCDQKRRRCSRRQWLFTAPQRLWEQMQRNETCKNYRTVHEACSFIIEEILLSEKIGCRITYLKISRTIWRKLYCILIVLHVQTPLAKTLVRHLRCFNKFN